MKPYQRQFIEFALSKQVLKFGEFTLKSGRKSPYFFNAGLFNTGRDLALLGRFYAEALVDSGIEFDLLFGPAYKVRAHMPEILQWQRERLVAKLEDAQVQLENNRLEQEISICVQQAVAIIRCVPLP